MPGTRCEPDGVMWWRLCVLRIGSGGEPLRMVRRPRGRRPLHLGGQAEWQVVPLDPLSPGRILDMFCRRRIIAFLFVPGLSVAGSPGVVATAPHIFGLPIVWIK
jgi:hypothetical protein